MKNKTERIIERCIRKISSDIPESAIVLKHLALKPVDEPIKLSTDWSHILYNEDTVLADYDMGGLSSLRMQLLHILMHGIFEDLEKIRTKKFLSNKYNNALIDVRAGMVMDYLSCEKESDEEADADIQNILASGYQRTMVDKKLCKKIMKMGKLMHSDDHNYWYSNDIVEEGNEVEVAEAFEQMKAVLGGSENSMGDSLLKMLLQSASKEKGTGTDGRSYSVDADDKGRRSYKDVIRDLVKKECVAKELPETIDTMLYTYGLEMYGDVPIVEPNEEPARTDMGTLFVAIDTSGSCEGERAGEFLRELRKLLQDIRGMFAEGRIVLLHCDEEIQKVSQYELQDIDKLGESTVMYGGGGTDFCPVFDYIKDYSKEKPEDIVGLLYWTDGYGDCPEKEPEYPVYFIMSNEDYNDSMSDMSFPKWIRRLNYGLRVCRE